MSQRDHKSFLSAGPYSVELAMCELFVRPVLGVLVLASFLACGPTPKTSVHRFPSGRQLDVFHTGMLDGEWTLLYQTQLELTREYMFAHLRLRHEDMPKHLESLHYALQCEADGLREDVQLDAEKNGASKIAIEPTSTKREFIGFDRFHPTFSESRSVKFVLEQDEQGIWRKTDGWTSGACGGEAVEQSDRADRAEPFVKS